MFNTFRRLSLSYLKYSGINNNIINNNRKINNLILKSNRNILHNDLKHNMSHTNKFIIFLLKQYFFAETI